MQREINRIYSLLTITDRYLLLYDCSPFN